MIYKKIVLTPKSWLITPLESDTVLSYIFAFNFEKLEHIYKKFQEWINLPFLITNWLLENTLPRPMFFSDEKHPQESSLLEDINEEVSKKKIKKITQLPLDKSLLELIFNWKNNEFRDRLKNISNNGNKEIVIDFKNSIPRFNNWDTNPYEIPDINYISWNYVIYVKLIDEKDFELFFDCLKNTFEKIWFWKWKSRWYGHFKNVEIKDLDINESEVFKYIDELKKQNLYFVLNNYKPKDSEIDKFNLDKSFYQLNSKHTKSLSEFNENIFKWQMNFISEWSVIYSDDKLVWDSYKSDNSYNFWFIF